MSARFSLSLACALLLPGACTQAAEQGAPDHDVLPALFSQDFVGSYYFQCGSPATSHVLVISADGSSSLDLRPLLGPGHPGATELTISSGFHLHSVESLAIQDAVTIRVEDSDTHISLHGLDCALSHGPAHQKPVSLQRLFHEFVTPWSDLYCYSVFMSTKSVDTTPTRVLDGGRVAYLTSVAAPDTTRLGPFHFSDARAFALEPDPETVAYRMSIPLGGHETTDSSESYYVRDSRDITVGGHHHLMSVVNQINSATDSSNGCKDQPPRHIAPDPEGERF